MLEGFSFMLINLNSVFSCLERKEQIEKAEEKERIQREKEEQQKKEAEEAKLKEQKGEEKVNAEAQEPVGTNTNDETGIHDHSPLGQVRAILLDSFSTWKQNIIIFMNFLHQYCPI